MQYELKEFPQPPEFENSAGRFLALLEWLPGKGISWLERATQIYGGTLESSKDFKAHAYILLKSIVINSYDSFVKDIHNSSKFTDLNRDVLRESLSGLIEHYTPSPGEAPRKVSDAHRGLLRFAGSILETEPTAIQNELDSVRNAINALWISIEDAELNKTVRADLLEIVRLARNALDQYAIFGTKGFHKAFKRMLGELLEIYSEEGKEVEKKSWWQPLQTLFATVEVVASKVQQYKPLIEWIGAATGYLPPPSNTTH